MLSPVNGCSASSSAFVVVVDSELGQLMASGDRVVLLVSFDAEALAMLAEAACRKLED